LRDVREGDAVCLSRNQAATRLNEQDSNEWVEEVKMNSEEQKRRQSSADTSKRTVKKPYVKPEVRHERVFETMALTCAKVQTTQIGCHFVRKNS
jgi:hypothetical protein